MFEAIRNLMSRLGRAGADEEFGFDDHRLAAAALMVHVADADGVYHASERGRLRDLLSTGFDLDAAAAGRLIDAARRSDREAIDFHGFASQLKRALDTDGRLRILGMLWDVAYADGDLHEFEADIVARVAEVLGIGADESEALQRASAGRARP